MSFNLMYVPIFNIFAVVFVNSSAWENFTQTPP